MWENIAAYTGWRRNLTLMVLGAFSAAALPPVYALPLLIPSFAGLFLMVRKAVSLRRAFWDGWWWGLGYFTLGLYWICISLFVEPDKFAWLLPFTLFGLPSVLGIYIAIVTCAFKAVDTKLKKPHIALLVFATLFILSEYARAHLFTGFPWNLIGYVWTVAEAPLQAASLMGVYGLSWLTVFAASVPALFVEKEKPLLPNLIALMLVVGLTLWGEVRLERHPTEYSNVRMRIVQGNIAQSAKWDPQEAVGILMKYAELTRSPGLEGIDLVVWPEAAIPDYITPGTPLLQTLGELVPAKTLLLAGGLRAQEHAGGEWLAWNSVFVIDHSGQVVTQYDKHHLVPFGEFIPLRHILPLENISGGHGDFSAGKGPATLAAGKVPPFSPLICYESIFPDEAVDKAHKPDWLLNVTNDAWFGRSSGPYQSLEMARMRAVENEMPLIRAANTGISAVIDAYGRVIMTLPLDKSGVIDSFLPKKIH
ncbi:MAG TPA: apolipoprotein N-acyltransferase [Rickettsiales bacterium]|nr:apolipoprotein N-acyltransferase [Rickettsiales bacterium]